MNLSELIFKRLSADENLQTMLATYAGAPAIFDSEFPADQQEGWEGATQYPRICYRIDMQVNQERSSAGTLYVAMYTDKTSTIIEDIETAVKHCLQDVLMKPAGEAPFCVAWARTESYAIEGKEVWCKEMAFDILEYPEQFSTDPDPVLAVAAYIKKIFPETTVLGIDNVGDFVETSRTPVFYCRLANIQHTTGHCMNTISWFVGKIAVHLIYPGAGTRLKTLASINQKVAIDEEIIMLDDSPMTIQGLELNNKSDYLREGQLTMLYNADGVPFAQVSSFQSKTSFNNTKYQPLGQNRELETNNTIGVTIAISEIVVLDGELFNNVVSAVNKGESPVMTLDGVIEGRNGSQERITYRECIFSGDQDLQNVSTGDTLSRSYNLHCNGEVEPRSSLTI